MSQTLAPCQRAWPNVWNLAKVHWLSPSKHDLISYEHREHLFMFSSEQGRWHNDNTDISPFRGRTRRPENVPLRLSFTRPFILSSRRRGRGGRGGGVSEKDPPPPQKKKKNLKKLFSPLYSPTSDNAQSVTGWQAASWMPKRVFPSLLLPLIQMLTLTQFYL